MPVITSSVSPLEAERGAYQRSKTQSFFEARSSTARPVSTATEFFETDFEDDSDFDDDSARKHSFESDDSRRRSQTTISSYDEASTPNSSRSRSQRQFEIRFKPVEGPKGPHLFRASSTSVELEFDYSLQMSPMLPKEPPVRTETALSYDTIVPWGQQAPGQFSIDAALDEPECNDSFQEEYVRFWSTHQVVDWMVSKEIDAPIIDTFELNDINGAALMDLQFDHLKELDIQSLGKRLVLWNEICQLRGGEGALSPQPTPFQDVSRPCTAVPTSSPDRGRDAQRSADDTEGTTPSTGKKRRGRKASKHRDVVTPAESVSIVAIEQLMPKPHKCEKGERCGKWRRQQREIQQLQNDHGLGTFPISPRKGGHVFVFGDPGNAGTAANIVPNVHKQHVDDSGTLTSDVIPSLVASSDLLGPGQIPEFALHEHYLDRVESRDAQDNVRQFLHFQHMQTPVEEPCTIEDQTAQPGSIGRSESVPLFPAQHCQAYPSLNPPPRSHTTAPRAVHNELPRLEIPRSSSAGPQAQTPMSAGGLRTASPSDVYRLGTPASEMDIPVTAIPIGPVARDASQSVPPNMHYRQHPSPTPRAQSTRPDRRRPSMAPPSMALPAVKEGEVFSPASTTKHKSTTSSSRPSTSRNNSTDSTSSTTTKPSIPDPSHHDPQTQYFGYGADCTHAGWMKKRRTKMLRHEWQDAHFRLKGTHLAMHPSARLSSAPTDTINVEDYAVACSSVASGNKLSAAMKAFHIKNADAAKKGKSGDGVDPAAFAFQLVPAKDGERKGNASSKTHHFSVKDKDERIDWMREIMLARALQQKGKGYDVEVNGVQL